MTDQHTVSIRKIVKAFKASLSSKEQDFTQGSIRKAVFMLSSFAGWAVPLLFLCCTACIAPGLADDAAFAASRASSSLTGHVVAACIGALGTPNLKLGERFAR